MINGAFCRKGVSWLDQERARSLSPPHNSTQREMSQFGSTGNLNSFRDRTTSPAYSALGRHKDDYNRFETARHAQSKQQAKDKTEESRFSGYGDRPGSGVELAGHHWHGGEIITNPQNVPKSLKPRRFYYSPIGDGTVAADGVELKSNLILGLETIKNSSMPASEGYGSEGGYGPGSGRNSRTGALSPGGGDFYGKGPSGGPTTGSGGPGGVGGGGPGSGLGGPSGPGSGNGGYGSGRGTPAGFGSGGDPYGSGRPGSGLGRDPYSTLDSRSGNPYGSNGNLGPGNDGRMSVASSVFSDPSYRFDTKTGYLITNPRELIHQYATTTPIAVMDTNDHTPTTTTVTKQSLYRKTEETTEFA
uniref:ZM domain-containing protein n=1 Tax=Heterorhabditis bacteriophora TaxID=37862 RepID=A0A1I7WX01_HETBA